jgi:hypothetical protein
MNGQRLTVRCLGAAAFLAGAVVAAAQTGTGTISGRVVDSQGLVLPGVTVTVRSPNLQRPIEEPTTSNGDYRVALLPPGSYTLTFELTGFATHTHTRDVAAAEDVALPPIKMVPAPAVETVEVTLRSNVFVGTVQSANNFTATTLTLLPTDRTLSAALDLSAGVHSTGFLGASMMSGGSFTENVFMKEGAQIIENIFSAPLPLLIEDAIQEITTTVSGIPAENGRFTGGVANVIARSGGNRHTGSFRTTLTNDNWRSQSPFGEPKTAQVVPTFEFTAGGPIVRSRTRVFVAGRLFDNVITQTLAETVAPYENHDNEKRFEVKLTQSVGAGQNVTVAYTHVGREISNVAFPNPGEVMDLRSLYDHRESQRLLSAHYAGAVGSNFSLEGQFVSRDLTLDRGSTSTDRIEGTMLQDRLRQLRRYWAPPLCGGCRDEQYDSTQVLVKSNYLVSTARGAHMIVSGYDMFNDNVLVDNHQTGSDFFVNSTSSIIRDGVVYPVFDNNIGPTVIVYEPILVPSAGWNFRTHALFVSDTWHFTDRVTFNLGARWDKNGGDNTSGRRVVTQDSFSPRLGAVWDVDGHQKWAVTASFSRYVGAVDGPVANRSSAAGRPADFRWTYLVLLGHFRLDRAISV